MSEESRRPGGDDRGDPHDLLISNLTVVAGDAAYEQYSPLADHAIATRGGRISWIGPSTEAMGLRADRVIDGAGRLAFPGLISTHNHLFQNIVKGLGDDLELWPIVESIIIPLAEEMTVEEAYVGALAACLEGIRTGRTTVLDFMYGLPDIEYHRAVQRACRETGVRGFLGRQTRELHHEAGHRDPWYLPLEEVLDQIRQLAGEYSNGLDAPSAFPAPGNPRTMTTEGLLKTKQFADDARSLITTHLAEYDEERAQGLRRWGKTTIAKLEEIGFLGPNLVAAHCQRANEDEIRALARTGTKVSYNPVSNCYIGGGIAPVVRMLDSGVHVSLATDGAAANNTQDMIESMKFGALLQKTVALDARAINARDMLAMATTAGATALGVPDQLGALEVGRMADFFLFNPRRLRTAPMHDPISTLVYTGGETNVETVVIDGRVVLDEGRFTTIDESAVIQEMQDRALAASRRAGTFRFAIGRRLTPFTKYESVDLFADGGQPGNGNARDGSGAVRTVAGGLPSRD